MRVRDLKVGDTVWILNMDCHRLASGRDGSEAKVTKMGRKWVSLACTWVNLTVGIDKTLPCGNHRGEHWAGPGYRIFANKACLDNYLTCDQLSKEIKNTFYSDAWRITLDKCQDARALQAVLDAMKEVKGDGT